MRAVQLGDTAPQVADLQSKAYTWGGKNVGTGQFVSIFRRAEFRSQTRPTGLNPDLQVNLTPTKTSSITVSGPGATPRRRTISCGHLGAMKVSWWDNQVQTVLMPKLGGEGVRLG